MKSVFDSFLSLIFSIFDTVRKTVNSALRKLCSYLFKVIHIFVNDCTAFRRKHILMLLQSLINAIGRSLVQNKDLFLPSKWNLFPTTLILEEVQS